MNAYPYISETTIARLMQDDQQRFWMRVDRRDADECWLWTGGTNGRGYGRFRLSGDIRQLAHRVSWQIANGRPINDGLVVCHSCDQPRCVNPAHLWLGTQLDNMRDAKSKGRHSSDIKELATQCKQGHDLTPENTYWYPKARKLTERQCRICRANYRARGKAVIA